MTPREGFHLFDAYAAAHPHFYALGVLVGWTVVKNYWRSALTKSVAALDKALRARFGNKTADEIERGLASVGDEASKELREAADADNEKAKSAEAAPPPEHMDDPHG